MRRTDSIYLLLLVLLVFSACSSPSANSQSANQPDADQIPIPSPSVEGRPPIDVSVTEYLRGDSPNLMLLNKLALLRAWKRVENYGNYRVTRPDDFRIPEWTKNERYRVDIDHAIEFFHASNYGDINRDSFPADYALTVIDRAKATPSNWGIIIFNERAGNEYDAFWLYRDKDLSKNTIGPNSGGIYINEFHEDGADTGCRVRWNRRKREYTCGEW